MSNMNKNIRVIVLGLLVLTLFSLYALNLFSMQIVRGQEYQYDARRVSSRVNILPAARGEIFDRNANQPLVINTDSFAVMMTPAEIPAGQYDNVASRLSKMLGMSKLDIDKIVPPSVRRSYQQIRIKANVPFGVVSNIAENKTDLPGVSWVSSPMRYYVETGSMSHIIGYVGDITQEEMNIYYNRGYDRTGIIGKSGIELQYDALLQGTPGWVTRTVDARGRNILSEQIQMTEPKAGNSLILTIDTNVQKLVEDTLGERVGAVVVLHAGTGEILAMVSYPYYNPNIFLSDDMSTQYSALLRDSRNPLLNRAVNVTYPPASTFKTIVSTAMLQENAFSETERIECSGEVEYGGRVFRCHIRKPGHGWLDLKNGLAQSCDVYYWIVGRDHLGIETIATYATEFGFGKSAQIDLPAQQAGLVPTPQWKERRFHQRWVSGDTMNVSIGQGDLLVTPLQVADMMAMVSNSGVIYKPHLLKEVRDSATGEIVQQVKPEVLFDSSIDKNVWKTVQESLRYTITDGSAQYPMHNRNFQIAGKTGTAEVDQFRNQNRWHSWMVAYAPYDAPPEDRIVVATIVEAQNEWEWWAPYATNIIIQGVLANQTSEEAAKSLGFQHVQQYGNRQE